MFFLYFVHLRRGVSFIFDTIFIVFMPTINYQKDLNPPFLNSRAAKAENIKNNLLPILFTPLKTQLKNSTYLDLTTTFEYKQ